MARNGLMRRSNLRRVATRIDRDLDALERALGPEPGQAVQACLRSLRRHPETIRREAEANAPRRAQERPQWRADTWIPRIKPRRRANV